jgi:hypothetical protein
VCKSQASEWPGKRLMVEVYDPALCSTSSTAASKLLEARKQTLESFASASGEDEAHHEKRTA